jgi:hypothetical protein
MDDELEIKTKEKIKIKGDLKLILRGLWDETIGLTSSGASDVAATNIVNMLGKYVTLLNAHFKDQISEETEEKIEEEIKVAEATPEPPIDLNTLGEEINVKCSGSQVPCHRQVPDIQLAEIKKIISKANNGEEVHDKYFMTYGFLRKSGAGGCFQATQSAIGCAFRSVHCSVRNIKFIPDRKLPYRAFFIMPKGMKGGLSVLMNKVSLEPIEIIHALGTKKQIAAFTKKYDYIEEIDDRDTQATTAKYFPIEVPMATKGQDAKEATEKITIYMANPFGYAHYSKFIANPGQNVWKKTQNVYNHVFQLAKTHYKKKDYATILEIFKKAREIIASVFVGEGDEIEKLDKYMVITNYETLLQYLKQLLNKVNINEFKEKVLEYATPVVQIPNDFFEDDRKDTWYVRFK